MRSDLWQRALTFIRETWQGEVLTGPQDPVPPSSLALVTREYLRDCSERGRTPHIEGEDLARAAAVYASPDRLVVEHTGMSPWPWPERCDEINQLTRVEQLTRAAVLCMREIDRLRKGGGVAQDHFAGGGKMVDNKEPTAAPCEREEPTVDNKDDFRPGLPPLELRRVWQAKVSRIERITTRSPGGEFAFDVETGKRATGSEQEEDPAKVAADKQPWERELERLCLKLAIVDVKTFAGFNEYGFPLVMRQWGDAGELIPLAMILDSHGESVLKHLWPIEKLRRVVESGQGSAEVPRAIIDRYPLADGKPRGEGCWMCCKSERLPEFEVFCDRGNFRDVFWTFGTTLNAFIHAAGNEMVAK